MMNQLVQIGPKVPDAALAKMMANSPTANDILNNNDFFNELNEEISQTYQEPGKKNMNKVPSAPPQVIGPKMNTNVRPSSTPTVKALSRDEEMEQELLRMNAEAQKLLAEKQEAEKKMQQELSVEEEVSPEERLREQIMGALKSLKNAPSEAQIMAWKKEFGDNAINVIALNETDVYVFTYIRRAQWQKINETVQTVVKSDSSKNGEELLKEKVVQYCVLWPKLSLEFMYNSRAGTADTLFNVIMAHSNFLQLSQAMMLTTQL